MQDKRFLCAILIMVICNTIFSIFITISLFHTEDNPTKPQDSQMTGIINYNTNTHTPDNLNSSQILKKERGE